MYFDTRNYLSSVRFNLLVFTSYILSKKSSDVMNMVCYDLTIKEVRYNQWNVIHLFFNICLGMNKWVLIQGMIYLQ